MEPYKIYIALFVVIIVIILFAAYVDVSKKESFYNEDNKQSNEPFTPIKDKDGAVIGGVHNPEYYSPSH